MMSPAAAVEFEGRDLFEFSPEERGREGIFLAFQYPVEIPGVNNILPAQGGAERNSRAPGAAPPGRR